MSNGSTRRLRAAPLRATSGERMKIHHVTAHALLHREAGPSFAERPRLPLLAISVTLFIVAALIAAIWWPS